MNDWAFLYPKSSQAFVNGTVKRILKKDQILMNLTLIAVP
ncbi:hypothetical protein VCHA41O245_50185 [Vibrio chagasii]|nr:hypothetical protein VCHA41O245_50185 [Vibrio chagasii]